MARVNLRTMSVVLNKVLTGGILWKKVVLKNFANLIGKHVVGVTF